MRFTVRSLEHCLSDQASVGVRTRIDHVFSEPPHTVVLPELRIGRSFLERMRVRELPGGVSWMNPRYDSFASPLFRVRDAVLHTGAGILAIDDVVVEETLAHTSADQNRYDVDGRSIALHEHARKRLSGANASLLTGSCGNTFHSMIDSVPRLAITRDAGVASFGSLLVPQHAPQALSLLALTDPDWRDVIEVGASDTIEVEELILPWTVHGQSTYYPCLKTLFWGMRDRAGAASCRLPRRIYVSRQYARNRRLSNEADLTDALAKIGFVPVHLETLSLTTQIQLFREAEIIVAPHGAGLTNIVFANPAAVVLELLMDSYVNWCFRHLAAMLEIRYDCVIGRAQGAWSELSPAVHGDTWIVSVPHVLAAVHTLSADRRA